MKLSLRVASSGIECLVGFDIGAAQPLTGHASETHLFRNFCIYPALSTTHGVSGITKGQSVRQTRDGEKIMGQGFSQSEHELPQRRQRRSEVLRQLGFGDDPRRLQRALDHELTNRKIDNLDSLPCETTLAEYMEQVKMFRLTLSIDLISDIVSFNAPVRPGSASRVASIEENMFRCGIYSEKQNVITVRLERNHDAAIGEVREIRYEKENAAVCVI